MPSLNLKPTHKPVREYYAALKAYEQLGVKHETAVKTAFQNLLVSCGRQFSWTLVPEWPFKRPKKQPLRIDGALVDSYNLARAYWEAKDSQDDLKKEVQKKFKTGYPKDNIIFQQPERAILYQDGRLVMDEDITDSQRLVDIVRQFFEYRPPAIDQWERAVEEFGERVKEHGNALLKLIQEQEKTNKRFIDAFEDFLTLCRQSINPNLSKQAVEEMLIQHLLTERIFRSVFNNPDFAQRNIIAVEIEKVINALTSKSFSRSHFLSSLDRFYGAIEETAATIDDFSQKQDFLNTIYERFFQGFSVKVADTHGIVYTPQPIVNFMVKSVEDVLQREFGKSLVDKGVHILDPFVGTGNFIIRIMREIAEIQKSALPYKYANELHCNEVMLLPYYIASMNIEREYFEQTGKYDPFEGICLVDTFELAEEEQQQLSLFTAENTERVERQKKLPLFVIIGNPPYNMNQAVENDNNRNRKYKIIDKRVSETYSKDSTASNVNKLNDPYVKAMRWAADRLLRDKEGVIAFITNSGFLDQIAFDGMRKHLAKDFDSLYIYDLGGNVRRNPKLSGTTHNVFCIQVGVSINILIKKIDRKSTSKSNIFYSRFDEFLSRFEKLRSLEKTQTYAEIGWQVISPDDNSTWLFNGFEHEFDSYLAIGNKKTKSGEGLPSSIFKTYSLGVATNRDAWTFNFNLRNLEANIETTIDEYLSQLQKWNQRKAKGSNPRDFIDYKDDAISWSEGLRSYFRRSYIPEFNHDKIRFSFYRPFTWQYLYFDECLNERRFLFPGILPSKESFNEIICVTNHSQVEFSVLLINILPCKDIGGRPTQCFPFYTYDEDGSNRKENITDWVLGQFQAHYEDPIITKWDIFYYTYAVLHYPHYRIRYAANLKRELPRIPYAPEFRPFATAGQRLADIHVHYEDQAEYPLKHLENKDLPIDWRVEKMRLSKDKTQLKYNDFLTLTGIPPEVFGYRLGNRSALDWVIDQYRIKTDKRSGITNDPNRLDDEEYIVRLIKKVITVSLETVKIVNALPDLGLPKD